jgi:hypothetical protein
MPQEGPLQQGCVVTARPRQRADICAPFPRRAVNAKADSPTIETLRRRCESALTADSDQSWRAVTIRRVNAESDHYCFLAYQSLRGSRPSIPAFPIGLVESIEYTVEEDATDTAKHKKELVAVCSALADYLSRSLSRYDDFPR